MKINIVSEKADRDLELATEFALSRKSKDRDLPRLAVRDEIYLIGSVSYLARRLDSFLRECDYDEQAEMRLDGHTLRLEGTRALTREEMESYAEGLFED